MSMNTVRAGAVPGERREPLIVQESGNIRGRKVSIWTQPSSFSFCCDFVPLVLFSSALVGGLMSTLYGGIDWASCGTSEKG